MATVHLHRSPPTKRSEKEVVVSLCSNIFLPLCSDVVLEKTYTTFLREKRVPVPLQTGHNGLGTTHTWHGTPDARVKETPLVWLNASEDPNDQFFVTEISDAESASIKVEGKVVATDANLMQIIGSCVVSSFTSK